MIKATNVALITAFAATTIMFGAHAETVSEHNNLYSTVAALDTAVFEAFNHCAEAGQLDKHASYFALDVEFYHDNGGGNLDS